MEDAQPLPIFIFGNSHVSQFTGANWIIPENGTITFLSPEFTYKVLRLGPSTAYNFFWNPNYYPRVLETLARECPEKGVPVALLLGEIDCRVHIGKQADEKQRPLEDCVEEVVDRLFLCYLDLKQRGYKPVALSVQPPSMTPPCTHPDSPVYGVVETRNEITRLFNTLLERRCRIHSIPFCSIFEELMEDELVPKPGLFMDYVHMRGSIVRPYYDKALRALLKGGS